MRLRRFFVVALSSLLAGCAALQIDVDVYKGPLANSDKTQPQQLASMALSAKPLLIETRNDLLDALADKIRKQRPTHPWACPSAKDATPQAKNIVEPVKDGPPQI